MIAVRLARLSLELDFWRGYGWTWHRQAYAGVRSLSLGCPGVFVRLEVVA